MISTKPERESCQWLADEFGGMATWQGTGIKKAQPVRVVVMGLLGGWRLEIGECILDLSVRPSNGRRLESVHQVACGPAGTERVQWVRWERWVQLGRIGSFPDRPGSRSSSLLVSQKQCADASPVSLSSRGG
jgi:hypothetical protein